MTKVVFQFSGKGVDCEINGVGTSGHPPGRK